MGCHGRVLQPLEPRTTLGELGLQRLLAPSGGFGAALAVPSSAVRSSTFEARKSPPWRCRPAPEGSRCRRSRALQARAPRARHPRPTSPTANRYPFLRPPSGAYGVSCRARAEGVALRSWLDSPRGGRRSTATGSPAPGGGGRIGIRLFPLQKRRYCTNRGVHAVALVRAATRASR